MAFATNDSPKLKISIRLASNRSALRNNHAAIQALYGDLTQMSYLDNQKIQVFNVEDKERDITSFSTEASRYLTYGLQFFIVPERLRATVTKINNWLDMFQVKATIEIQIPANKSFISGQTTVYIESDFTPSRTIRLSTNKSEDLAEVVILIEAILPKTNTYLCQLRQYVKTRGEFTPSARANLRLLSHALGLSKQEVEGLNAKVLSTYITLKDKYDYYKEELYKNSQNNIHIFSQDSTSDGDSRLSDFQVTLQPGFSKVMEDKAEIISLPPSDAQFIIKKYLDQQAAIREQDLQKSIELETTKKNERLKRFEAYQVILRQVMLNDWQTVTLSQNESFLVLCQRSSVHLEVALLFFKHMMYKKVKSQREIMMRQELFKVNSKIDFNKVQTKKAKKKYIEQPIYANLKAENKVVYQVLEEAEKRFKTKEEAERHVRNSSSEIADILDKMLSQAEEEADRISETLTKILIQTGGLMALKTLQG
jgi:hypothetical protein